MLHGEFMVMHFVVSIVVISWRKMDIKMLAHDAQNLIAEKKLPLY
jgi:hypothetical protein